MWLAEHVASGERRPERVREELILRCRAELIEPPTPDRVSEIARSALYQAEQALLALIAERLDPAVVARLEALIAVSDDDQDENVLGLIKAAPGNVSLETMLVEISKLEAIRAIGLPADLFDGIDARIIAGWRARAAVESPGHLREHPQPTKLALLCALLYTARAGGHRQPRAAADLDGAPDQRARRAEGHRGARQGLQARHGQGDAAAQDRRGVPGHPGRHGPRGDLPGRRRRGDAEGSRGRVPREGDRVSAPEAQGVQGVLHQSLPPRADPAARRARVPLQQHRPPARHRRAHVDRALRPQQRPVLPARRARRPRRRRRPGLGRPADADRLARAHPDHPKRVRGVRLSGAARAAALQGDLGRRRARVAQPRRGPPDRLRDPPGRALRQAPQAAGPRGVHRTAAGRDAHRARRAQRRAPRAWTGCGSPTARAARSNSPRWTPSPSRGTCDA